MDHAPSVATVAENREVALEQDLHSIRCGIEASCKAAGLLTVSKDCLQVLLDRICTAGKTPPDVAAIFPELLPVDEQLPVARILDRLFQCPDEPHKAPQAPPPVPALGAVQYLCPAGHPLEGRACSPDGEGSCSRCRRDTVPGALIWHCAACAQTSCTSCGPTGHHCFRLAFEDHRKRGHPLDDRYARVPIFAAKGPGGRRQPLQYLNHDDLVCGRIEETVSAEGGFEAWLRISETSFIPLTALYEGTTVSVDGWQSDGGSTIKQVVSPGEVLLCGRAGQKQVSLSACRPSVKLVALTADETAAREALLRHALREKRVGVRVRRGPDWWWPQGQDGGDGKLGTTAGGDPRPGWIKVRWDAGGKYSYRVGDCGQYDLLVATEEPGMAAYVEGRGEIPIAEDEGPDTDIEDAVPAVDDSEADMMAQYFASMGVTVKQLLVFYMEHQLKGLLDEDMTVAEVVSRIVVPDTAAERCCYMEGAFMKALGGPKRATILVSQGWKDKFANTVKNVVLDAVGATKEEMQDFQPGELLDKYASSDGLSKSYWLCAFALDQHRRTCEDYSSCQPKVVQAMEAVVVSLDPALTVASSIWVAADVAEAVGHIPISFPQASGVDAELVYGKLRRGQRLLLPIQDCEARSEADKALILDRACTGEGGEAAFHGLVACLLELHFGGAARLGELGGAAAEAATKLSHLNMDMTWAKALVSLTDLLGPGHQLGHIKLRKWSVNLSGCEELEDVGALAAALATQTELLQFELNLAGCKRVPDAAVAALGGALPASLEELSLNLASTLVADNGAGALGQRMPQALQKLRLDLSDTQVSSACARNLTASIPSTLKELELDFAGTRFSDPGLLVLGQRLPQTLLLRLALNFKGTRVTAPGMKPLTSGVPPRMQVLSLTLPRGPFQESALGPLREEVRAKASTCYNMQIRVA